APVRGRAHALDPAAPFKLVEDAHQPGRLDPDRVRDFGLRATRIGLDDHQNRVVRDADVGGGKRLDQILEDPDLKAAGEIADVLVEFTKREPFPARRGYL